MIDGDIICTDCRGKFEAIKSHHVPLTRAGVTEYWHYCDGCFKSRSYKLSARGSRAQGPGFGTGRNPYEKMRQYTNYANSRDRRAKK